MSGSGGASGYDYQADVFAFVAAHAIARHRLDWFDDLADVPNALSSETGGPGDDLEIELRTGERVELQAKHGLTRGVALNEALTRLISALAQDPKLRCVLLVDSTSSGTIRNDLRVDIVRLGEGRTDCLTSTTQEIFAFLGEGGLAARSLFQRLRLVVKDLREGEDGRAAALAVLSHVVASPDDTVVAWDLLGKEGHRQITRRGRRDASALARMLAAKIQLRVDGQGEAACEGLLAKYILAVKERLRLLRVLDLGRSVDLIAGFVTVHIDKLRGRFIAEEDARSAIEKGLHASTIEREHAKSRNPVCLADAVRQHRALALVGDPGSGKSTLLKNLCIVNSLPGGEWVPVFVAVRDLVAAKDTLADAVRRQLCLGQVGQKLAVDVFDYLSAHGRLLLCLDGLDELDITEPAESRQAVRRIRTGLDEVLARHSDNRVVVSVRRESWPTCRPEMSPDVEEYEVLPLGHGQTRTFIRKWFGQTDPCRAEALIDECRLRGWPEFTVNPLLLALTCIVYEKRSRLPDRPSILYQRCLDVLLEEWDATRRLSRRERVRDLTPERKLDLLAEVAVHFHLCRKACFSRAEALDALAENLPKIGLAAVSAVDALDEITTQHGLLRSWSIEGHLAFPHLCFQEYLAAKAQRDRQDGHLELRRRKEDPYWAQVVRLYASQGDASHLVEGLLAERDTVMHQSLFLAAECIAGGNKVNRTDLRARVLGGLEDLARGQIAYLGDKAVDALATLGGPDANAVLRSLIRDEEGKLRTDARASTYVLLVEGDRAVDEVLNKWVHSEHMHDPLLQSIRWLPQAMAQECLEWLITTTDYPVETHSGEDFGIRHRRRDAARLLAMIGEWEAIPALLRALKAPVLDDFEKSGVVDAIASVQHDDRRSVLEGILSDSTLPTDCRVRAAAALGGDHDGAGRYLRDLVADPNADHYDRRDAASILCGFELTTSDCPVFQRLLFDDRWHVFWGGPAYAAQALAKIGSPDAMAMLREAVAYWTKSPNQGADRVRNTIEQLLFLFGSDPKSEEQLVTLTSEGDGRPWAHYPELILHYHRQDPERASELACNWLDTFDACWVTLGTRAWAFYRILDRIQVTPRIVRSLIGLARRLPHDILPWAALDNVWRRWDLSPASRATFYLSEPS